MGGSGAKVGAMLGAESEAKVEAISEVESEAKAVAFPVEVNLEKEGAIEEAESEASAAETSAARKALVELEVEILRTDDLHTVCWDTQRTDRLCNKETLCCPHQEKNRRRRLLDQRLFFLRRTRSSTPNPCSKRRGEFLGRLQVEARVMPAEARSAAWMDWVRQSALGRSPYSPFQESSEQSRTLSHHRRTSRPTRTRTRRCREPIHRLVSKAKERRAMAAATLAAAGLERARSGLRSTSARLRYSRRRTSSSHLQCKPRCTNAFCGSNLPCSTLVDLDLSRRRLHSNTFLRSLEKGPRTRFVLIQRYSPFVCGSCICCTGRSTRLPIRSGSSRTHSTCLQQKHTCLRRGCSRQSVGATRMRALRPAANRRSLRRPSKFQKTSGPQATSLERSRPR